ncbi:toxin-antitoxin system YwqK family antitoxin [Chitinophaga japonensis]|uniref:MORN repeat protein n=1 Tax=Chitinophaga japonensis TaxID=104662 RepID=A0A562T0H7_CHIJA|nr:hypothetical protein [Chitinophaga japonensis]TWI86808.1 MORN repeat protein [Chitinophaga japonensis]
MKRTILLIAICCAALFAQAQTNQRDAKQRKQGRWMEEVAPLRGEPGYTWEGTYKNDRKEGVWKKYNVSGDLVAEETFQQGVLDGPCKYYYRNGRLSAAGNMLAMEIEGEIDTVLVIDPVTQDESRVEVVRKGNSVRHGEWRLYDEEGHMIRETYSRGELVTEDRGPQRKANAPLLPHEMQAKEGKRKKD